MYFFIQNHYKNMLTIYVAVNVDFRYFASIEVSGGGGVGEFGPKPQIRM